MLLPSISNTRTVALILLPFLNCLFPLSLRLSPFYFPSIVFPVTHNHCIVLTQIWNVNKKIIVFEKIVFFYLSIVSFINLSLISISFFVARVKSFMYSGAAFVLTEVTTFLHCLWTVKFQCVYSALLDGFKEDHTFDPYLLCFSFYYSFFLLLLWDVNFFCFIFSVYICLILKIRWFPLCLF